MTFCDLTFFLFPEVHAVFRRLFFQRMMRASARRAEKIIAVSESTARDLVRVFGEKGVKEKVHAIPLAASEDFRPAEDSFIIGAVCARYNLPTGHFILSVGVLEPRKNIPTLLRAYRYLVDRGVQQRLAVVGERGWMCEEIFTTVRALRLEDRVIFTGYAPDADLSYLYNGASLFVYPSLYEGFGPPVLEAMACGTPVMTSNVSSMCEIVGESGILVNPLDANELAQGIEQLLQDDNLRKYLRAEGLKRATNFSWERTARETMKVYLEAYGCSLG